MKHPTCALLLVALAAGSAAFAQPPNVVYVLDGSNSMWGRIGGATKIDTAKGVLTDLARDAAGNARLALVAYGHRDPDSCTDIEVLAPLGSSADALAAAIGSVTPKGKTPISAALEAAVEVFGNAETSNNIVLISDGIETCDADPCATAARLRERGISTRVHVVGFDVNAEQRRSLECIADSGGGDYYQAADADQLEVAVARVQEAAATPAPAPRKQSKTRFVDEFDGGELAGHWEMLSPQPDSWLVENGALLLLNTAIGGFNVADASNLLRLDPPALDGDWDLQMTLTGQLKTGRDRVEIGLWDSPGNYLVARLWTERSDVGGCSNLAVTIEKASNGETTRFTRPLRGAIGCGGPPRSVFDDWVGRLEQVPATLVLAKRGRTYSARLEVAGEHTEDGQPEVHETDSLTSLRLPGDPVITVGKHQNAQGEVVIFIDRVEILGVDGR